MIRTFSRFGVLTVLSFTVNVGLTALLHEIIGAPEEIAFALSILVVFIMNFIFQRYYVFAGTDRGAANQLMMYLIFSMAFRGSEYLSFLVMHTWLGVQYLVAIVSVLGVSFFAKFFFYDRVVFARKRANMGLKCQDIDVLKTDT